MAGAAMPRLRPPQEIDMLRRSTFAGLLLALLLLPRVAIGETKVRCVGGTCDFLVTGGSGDGPRLVLQPSETDVRDGRIVMNGFVDLLPDWRPSAKSGVDRLFSFAPKATLSDGAVMRIFDIAPDLTVPDVVGGTLFSVTGSLTRTGSSNPLY